MHDVLIVGGGPAGLSAALALGRARKRVLLTDSGPRRNARAELIHNFVTRDGTPPDEFRSIARAQLSKYSNVEARAQRVLSISGSRGEFQVTLEDGALSVRRVLLATGMVDELLPIDGFSELWGHAIFQCPYCHGWEIQDGEWAYLARAEHAAHLPAFALQARGWTKNLTVIRYEDFPIDDGAEAQLRAAGIALAASPLRGLIRDGERLKAVELQDRSRVACQTLFAHPPQSQVSLVRTLGLELDEFGFVSVDPMRRETSIPGVYAAGDLTSRMQGATFAAAAGVHAATMLNLDLNIELAPLGLI